MKPFHSLRRRFAFDATREVRNGEMHAVGGASPSDALPYELNPGSGRAQLTTISYDSAADTRIEVFWKDFTGGRGVGLDPRLADGVGPVISLIVAGFEVMRFDCLGGTGHFHAVLERYSAESENRVWFRECDQLEQVERSIFELEKNLAYFLARNPRQQVRDARLEPEEHLRNCALARDEARLLWSRNRARINHESSRPPK